MDDDLCVKGTRNILQENLFTVMLSVKMTASSRLLSVLHLAICLPFRGLTGNTHKLAHHGWGARSMGHAVDLIHGACKEIVGDVSLIHNESCMLYIFDNLRSELPEFDAYLKYEFEKQKN